MRPNAFLGTMAASILATVGAGAEQFELARSSIDGGGVMRSTGGAFELSGTIGQPDVGVLIGADYELSGGFWFPIPPGDCNEDGGIRLKDVADFEECLLGPDDLSAEEACRCFDLDGSGRVDLLDFAAVQIGFSSP